jgi:hypothetical protein
LSFSAEVIDEYLRRKRKRVRNEKQSVNIFGPLLGFNSGRLEMYAALMREADIAARIERLVSLPAGFAREIAALKDQRLDPSLRKEAQDYLAAIRSAQDAVDRGWIALVKLKPKVAKLSQASLRCSLCVDVTD